MLGVILCILKIIGIVLLAILALLLALLLIVLFVPVRYRANGFYKDNKYQLKANASYLLHIISVGVCFEGKLEYYIKIFGIPLNLKRFSKKNKANKISDVSNSSDNNASASNDSIDDSDASVEDNFNEDNNNSIKIENDNLSQACSLVKNDSEEQTYSIESEQTPDIAESEEPKEAEDTKESQKVEEKSSSKNDNNSNPSDSSKLQKFKDIIELSRSEEAKAALACCKDRLGKAIKSVLPRKGRIYLAFGNENAGLAGEILAVYMTLYAYIGKVVKFVPLYTEKRIEADFNLKGHIRAINLLYQLIRIYFDKNCRKLIKYFKEK